MTFTRLNIGIRTIVPALSFFIGLIGASSCNSIERRESGTEQNTANSRQWYRQALVDLGAKIDMASVNAGIAISRGMGKDVKGKAYRFTNGQWVPFNEFAYSDYPLIARSDSSNIWTINHLTHDGAYRPVLSSFYQQRRSEIPLPGVMWDEVDYVMFKGLHRFADGTAWMVGQQGHILYYDGRNWEEVKSPLINVGRTTVYEGDLNDIVMTSRRTGWAVGRNGNIIRYQNGEWSKAESPINQTLQSISMLNDSTGWAVGNSGTILQCRRYQWTAVQSDVREQLSSVTAADERNAWIVGNNSTLLSFDGTLWRADRSAEIYDDHFTDISAVKDSSGQFQFWIIGNEGIYTTYQSLGVSFTDVTDQAGLRRIGKLGHFFGRSSADRPDLLVANDGGTSLLYEINDENVFTDITGGTALITSPKDALIMAVGDVNNDGEQDILEITDHRNFGMYLGTGAGGFREFTERSLLSFDEINPLFPAAAKFIDLDNDGNLDLYVSNYDLPDQIFSGDGTGRFFRIAADIGIAKILHHASYGAVFGDFNNDRLTDILIPYYVSSGGKFFSMFRNTGRWTFEEIEDSIFTSSTDLSPTAATVLDFNNDGHLDLYIHSQKIAPLLWMNDGTGKFTDVSRRYGFTEFAGQLEPINGIVANADVNNDGWIDIFAGSRLFVNSPNAGFTEVAVRVGIQFVGTPAFADVDNDGDQDIFIGSSRAALGKGDRAALYRNNVNKSNYLKVRVESDVSNRTSIGARIEVTDGTEMKQVRVIGLGGSQLTTQNLQEVHFGVDRPSTVSVTFPSGIVRTLQDIQPGSTLTITESNMVTRTGILIVQSILRMLNLFTVPMLVMHFIIISIVVVLLVAIGRWLDALSIVRRPLTIIAAAVTYLFFLHAAMYETEIVRSVIAGAGSLAVSVSGMLVARSVIRKREAQFIGHFKIVELLGSGGMGKVYKAIDTVTKQSVALKVLNPELLKDPENRRRLSAEGHLLSSFRHPNIVKVFETGESNGQGFIAMEYLSGGTLREKLEQEHPLSLDEIKQYLLQICDGLSEVHNSDIIHRDLKTGNVMLHEDGTVRIMDFGLSKSPLVTTMTTLGTVLGTLGYVAPEQVTGLNVDRRTDIFSFGVLMYELLTKELPFKGENEIALIHSIFNTVPSAPSEKRPDIPKEWDTIVMKCLSKDPNARYASVNEIQILLNT